MHRVIYAWNYIEWGGAQIHFLALIKEARKEFDASVILPEGTDQEFLRFLDAEKVKYDLFRGHLDGRPKSGVLQKLGRHANKIKSEFAMLRAIEKIRVKGSIVHCELLPTTSLLSLVLLALRGPVFVTSHNAMPPVRTWRYALWKAKSRAISLFHNFHFFCTNEHASNYFNQLFSRRVTDDLKITYDSINVPEIENALSAPFDRENELMRFGIDPNKFIVLSVGQFVDRKGRWTLLESASDILRKNKDIVFVWIAPSRPSDVDAERIASYALGDGFRLLKSSDVGTDRPSIIRFFRVGDVFALPSFIEGIPIAMLEAMGLGIPSLSTNVYGIPEAIIDGETGLLIEAGDAAALTDAIERLYCNPMLRKKLAERGRKFVMTKFDERKAATTVVNAYRDSIKPHHQTAPNKIRYES